MTVVNDEYYVSEIFRSIQGEGNYAGVNSLFIRFQFCQLTCNWCDSKYTWYEKSGHFRQYEREALLQIIHQSPCHHIIFTGGEPTLYRLDLLYLPGKKFHVETNGNIIPTSPLDIRLADGTHIVRKAMDEKIIERYNWVISPKLKNAYQEIDRDALCFWSSRPYAIFKFIIRSADDLEEIAFWQSECKLNPNKIYVGLEGISLHSQLQPDLVDKIIESGYHFSPRLHILLWGNKRGK
ncbi:MAG TPA: 7-carboxy-7-deazaguanine synthase QueE [Bacteroidales bacterium]|nr:7-carboxy-7-deazaguanine synthase QueE [Bacteroidales bacterium]HOK98215.1 7-carboxy-7-deazaguanine synthase QueE [Bacteroidales bacterium]HPO64994.1 7-carboxy-7-deazaguanine synthase QueE [Bacteroidales bacterium]